jgi:uncharacterized protein (TIGR03437 family)
MLRAFCIRLAIVVPSALAVWGQQYTISTIAGDGQAGYIDGAVSTDTQLNLPANIAVTSSGTVYIADSGNHRVRMLSGGNVTTVAGDGTANYSGDGAAATAAELRSPSAVAVDSSGNIYISDTGNNVIRKITSGGTISTFAGNNGFGAGFSGDGGPAAAAQLSGPVGIALDSAGNLYIADSGNNCIRKVTASTGIISTVVGGGIGLSAGTLNGPVGLALDSAGDIFIADLKNKRIAKYIPGGNPPVKNFAGNGANGFAGDGGQANSFSTMLNNAQGVAVDAAGNVYIADTVNSRIRKVDTNNVINTIAGTGRQGYSGDGGPATSAQLYSPTGVVVDKSGNIYVADTHNQVIRLLTPSLPAISSGGVGNGASFRPPLSPGALATVVGTGFGTATGSLPANPNLPTSSGGVSVTVNGRAAPLYYVSPAQINFQVPWETATGTASVVVMVSGGASNTASIPVTAAGPGLFLGSDGTSAVVQNYPSYTLNSPSNGAPAGSTIIAYLTGSGPVNPPVATGALTPSDKLVQSTSSWGAKIGPAAAQVSFIGLTPGYLGLVQANIVVPSSLAPGTYPLTVTIGGETSNAGNITTK